MGGVYTRADARGGLGGVVKGLNALIDRDAGNTAEDAKQVRWTRFDGSRPDPHGGAATTSLFTHVIRSGASGGLHRGTLLSATAHDVEPTPANAVERVTDAGLAIGAGKYVRLYDAAGTDYVELTSDADGGLVLGGSGASAGLLTLNGNIAWKSGTAFTMTLDHAATANRAITFQDLAGTVALLGAANVGDLLFADNAHDIGASGATRPRDLFLARNAVIGADLTVDTTTLKVDATNNKVGILTASPTAALTVDGRVQVTGSAAPSGGSGLELAAGVIVAFNRGAGAYNTLSIDASSLSLAASGVTRFQVNGTGLGFFAVTPVARAAALTQTYSTADRTLGAYTADVENAAYAGIVTGLGGGIYAQVADLNALRVAYENLRAFTEDLAQHHNALVDDLQAYGLEQ